MLSTYISDHAFVIRSAVVSAVRHLPKVLNLVDHSEYPGTYDKFSAYYEEACTERYLLEMTVGDDQTVAYMLLAKLVTAYEFQESMRANLAFGERGAARWATLSTRVVAYYVVLREFRDDCQRGSHNPFANTLLERWHWVSDGTSGPQF